MANHLRLLTLISLFSFQQAFSQVVINEYSCSNRNIVSDNYGEYEDYIELYNTTGSTVDLNGWYLSDDESNPTKYQINSSITSIYCDYNFPLTNFTFAFPSGTSSTVGLIAAPDATLPTNILAAGGLNPGDLLMFIVSTPGNGTGNNGTSFTDWVLLLEKQ